MLGEEASPTASPKGAHAYGEIVPHTSAPQPQPGRPAGERTQPSSPFTRADSPRVSLIRDDKSATEGAIILLPFHSAAGQEPSLSPWRRKWQKFLPAQNCSLGHTGRVWPGRF